MRSSPSHCALRQLALLATLLVAACNSYDADLLGSAPTVSANRSECRGRTEICNNRDDDCDGIIDEGASPSCSLDHARSHCSAGTCVLDACDEGYLSCDDDSANGCEHELAACGGCDAQCDASMPRDSEPPRVDAGKISEAVTDADADAGVGERDNDAGSEQPCTPERCDGVDNDCDGRTDEGLLCNCTASAPTGQGPECDRCACERCSAPLAQCLTSGSADWDTSCGALMRCVGKNTLDGKCSEDADCGSACGSEWVGAGWRPNRACNANDISTACAAFVQIQETCYQTKCDKACKH